MGGLAWVDGSANSPPPPPNYRISCVRPWHQAEVCPGLVVPSAPTSPMPCVCLRYADRVKELKEGKDGKDGKGSDSDNEWLGEAPGLPQGPPAPLPQRMPAASPNFAPAPTSGQVPFVGPSASHPHTHTGFRRQEPVSPTSMASSISSGGGMRSPPRPPVRAQPPPAAVAPQWMDEGLGPMQPPPQPEQPPQPQQGLGSPANAVSPPVNSLLQNMTEEDLEQQHEQLISTILEEEEQVSRMQLHSLWRP